MTMIASDFRNLRWITSFLFSSGSYISISTAVKWARKKSGKVVNCSSPSAKRPISWSMVFNSFAQTTGSAIFSLAPADLIKHLMRYNALSAIKVSISKPVCSSRNSIAFFFNASLSRAERKSAMTTYANSVTIDLTDFSPRSSVAYAPNVLISLLRTSVGIAAGKRASSNSRSEHSTTASQSVRNISLLLGIIHPIPSAM